MSDHTTSQCLTFEQRLDDEMAMIIFFWFAINNILVLMFIVGFTMIIYNKCLGNVADYNMNRVREV